MNWIRKHFTIVILTAVFLIGLCLLLYPSLSDCWNFAHQSQVIAEYAETVSQLDEETCDRLLEEAAVYNEKLTVVPERFNPDEETHEEYLHRLDITGDGIMGYIEIEKIQCSLPIYHGTDSAVLQIAIGHMEGSSLPVGGEGTHCVLSGHRGLPSAKLFTDIDQLEEGDTFVIRVLDETLTYEVDQIRIVLPDAVDLLDFEEGQDYCTLVTCTPYGVNTHRLLVRGRRIESENNSVMATSEALQIDSKLIAAVMAVLFLVLKRLAGSVLKFALNKRKRRQYREALGKAEEKMAGERKTIRK